MDRFKILTQAIVSADTQPMPANDILTGFSGEKLLNTLINLSKVALDDDCVYLEVGVFQGLSLLSVASNAGKNRAFGIDNFAFFDPDGKNESIVRNRIDQLKLTNVTLINRDYEDALINLSEYIGDKKVGLFFVDGPHDYRSQLICLLLIQPYLADNAVIVVDDCNYRHVRLANSDFLQANKDFKLFFEAYTTSHPNNMTPEVLAQARKGWWNGVNVMVRDKNNSLRFALPSTLRDRTLQENEHILQTEKYPTLSLKYAHLIRKVGRWMVKLPKNKSLAQGEFDTLNTYSRDLPAFHVVND